MASIKQIASGNTPYYLKELNKETLIELQTLLSKLKHYPKDKIDGIYGPITLQAWKDYKESIYQNKPEFIGPSSAECLLQNTKGLPQESELNLAHKLYNCCLDRNYKLDKRAGAVNIIGAEGLNADGSPNNDAADRWNDLICILTFVHDEPKLLCSYIGTTEPGRYYTINPLNNRGAARMQLGQHLGLWVVGKHRGYEAMQQVGPARLVRDKNRNFLRDDKETVESWIGVNLHTTKTTGWRGSFNNFIGQWSAGCTVIQNPNSFLNFMKLIKGSTQYKANKAHRFDYTLLWRDWI